MVERGARPGAPQAPVPPRPGREDRVPREHAAKKRRREDIRLAVCKTPASARAQRRPHQTHTALYSSPGLRLEQRYYNLACSPSHCSLEPSISLDPHRANVDAYFSRPSRARSTRWIHSVIRMVNSIKTGASSTSRPRRGARRDSLAAPQFSASRSTSSSPSSTSCATATLSCSLRPRVAHFAGCSRAPKN